jgi:hypothetical protein
MSSRDDPRHQVAVLERRICPVRGDHAPTLVRLRTGPRAPAQGPKGRPPPAVPHSPMPGVPGERAWIRIPPAPWKLAAGPRGTRILGVQVSSPTERTEGARERPRELLAPARPITPRLLLRPTRLRHRSRNAARELSNDSKGIRRSVPLVEAQRMPAGNLSTAVAGGFMRGFHADRHLGVRAHGAPPRNAELFHPRAGSRVA